ncbi:YbaK/EbsC family protein [Microbacterium sp. LRZ72]|uniref:aminoacyl-tRNA deacylase n=1 Tax=Microbacterium sp. LRZ72 TaxID=2942481 RepID=UPI0029A1B9B3|nr:YbaK/EbsC family protein [Microbacterium sp. LRZ72]MDX2376246.1 YbaK/EbsC family protein [Microbacterium sp. LRZ72]
MPEPAPSGHDPSEDAATARVRDAASSLGLSIRVRRRPPARSLEEAAAALGIAPREIVKTLVVARRGEGFLFALVPGDRQISWPKLRAALGVNRLRLATPDEALAATGYERGTIVPLGSAQRWPVVADASIGGQVSMGAGSHGYNVVADAAELLSALDAVVTDITDVPSAAHLGE